MLQKYHLLETENLNGDSIKLVINYYKRKQRCAEIIVNTSIEEYIKHKAIFAFVLAAFNIVMFHLGLSSPTFYFVIFSAISYPIFKILFKVKNEKLLIVKSFGIQFTIQYYIGSHRTKFIPWSDINRIFINEIITQQKVLFVLTVTTKQDKTETLIPLFQNIKPRLNCLEIIYREIENIMLYA